MKQTLFVLILISTALALAGCQTIMPVTPTPDAALPPITEGDSVRVEGKLVPLAYVNLSFNMSGKISALDVQEGQQVRAGQVIARLDQRERLASAVAAADLDVVNARLALQALNDQAGVVTALALQRVADARDGVRDAERYLTNLNKGGLQTDIDSASANLVLLKDRLDQANEDFASYENKPEDNLTRAAYLSRLADAQRRYDDAVRLLNNLEGPASEIDLAIAEANLLLAQARSALAEDDYADVQSGPDPDDLRAAQARLNAAESSLLAAQAAQADAELVAPFSGVLVKLNLKIGEQAVPGLVSVVLADLSQWKVETEDLNEMEIPQVFEGQAVKIIPDALPDLELSGTVESISQIYIEKFGDVTYTSRILLTQTDPRLRWGMTVSVLFEQ